MIKYTINNMNSYAMDLQDRTVVKMIQPDVDRWLGCSSQSDRMQALDLLAEKLANIPPVDFAVKKKRRNYRHKHNHCNKKGYTMKNVTKNNKIRNSRANEFPAVRAALNMLRTSAQHTATENAFDSFLAGEATEDDVKREVDFIVKKHNLEDYIYFSTCDDIARRQMLDAFNADKYGVVFEVLANRRNDVACKLAV